MKLDANPFSEVRAFIDLQREAAQYKQTTAASLDSACAAIETMLSPGNDTIGYVSANLDALIDRFSAHNRHVGASTLITYRDRARRAIADYKAFLTDPHWQPVTRPGRFVPAQDGHPANEEASTGLTRSVSRSPSGHPVTASVSGAGQVSALRHRFPLRDDFDVELLVPRDFSAKEAKRVVAWITALATPDQPEKP